VIRNHNPWCYPERGEADPWSDSKDMLVARGLWEKGNLWGSQLSITHGMDMAAPL
jgi:hypothetical protein